MRIQVPDGEEKGPFVVVVAKEGPGTAGHFRIAEFTPMYAFMEHMEKFPHILARDMPLTGEVGVVTGLLKERGKVRGIGVARNPVHHDTVLR